jgi:hypothetical protein
MEAHLGDPLVELQQTLKPSYIDPSVPCDEPSVPHPNHRTPSPEMLYHFEQEEYEIYKIPTRANIILSCIDNCTSQPADMKLSYEPFESVPNVPPADYLPSTIGKTWNSLYQAAILTILDCQELLNVYDENERLLSISFEPTHPMTTAEIDTHITHRTHLQKIMHRLVTSLEVEQLELAHSIQYYLMRDEDEPKH